jgi:ElaB/YqjD/DUF883 family membrane-anchored ribosome-binding protein
MDERSQVRAVKDAVSDTAQSVMDVAADAGAQAQELARDAGRRASAAAETAYETGSDVAVMVEGVVRQNPWASLLVAMAAGYGLACLVKHQRH